MTYLKSRFALFKNAAFSFYTLSCIFAMFGNGLTYVTLSWILVESQHNVAALSGLMFSFWLPNILFSPFLGVLTDRWHKKNLLLLCNALRMILLFVFYFVFLTYPQKHLPIYLLGFISGTIISLYIPTAIAFVREIVDKKVLLNANATADMAYELGALLGMGSSGIMIALFNAQVTLLINALCYLIAFFFVLCIPKSSLIKNSAEQQTKNSYRHDLLSGLNYLKQNKGLRHLYFIQMLTFCCYMTAPVLLVPFSKSILHASAGEFGIIESAMSFGMVFGGILTPYFASRFGYQKTLLLNVITGASAFFFFSESHLIITATGIYLFVGFSLSAWALITTLAQEKTEIKFQGRVQSLFTALSGVVVLLFYLSLSVLAERFPVNKLYWFEVGLYVLAALIIWQSIKDKPC